MYPLKSNKVRQGGILSTMHYKLFINDLLPLLQRLGVGMTIGQYSTIHTIQNLLIYSKIKTV